MNTLGMDRIHMQQTQTRDTLIYLAICLRERIEMKKIIMLSILGLILTSTVQETKAFYIGLGGGYPGFWGWGGYPGYWGWGPGLGFGLGWGGGFRGQRHHHRR